jgi:cytochrome c553
MASSSRLKPGEKGKIKVAVDIRGKFGKIVKTVQVVTNDPQRRQTTLSLKMVVKDLIHMKKHKAAEIFGSACRGCHVDRGKSRKGFDLFLNDCTMCHNTGSSAATLARMRAKPVEDVEKAIREGIDKTSMPGWDIRHGGPLSEEEIRSLVDYIKPSARRGKGR